MNLYFFYPFTVFIDFRSTVCSSKQNYNNYIFNQTAWNCFNFFFFLVLVTITSFLLKISSPGSVSLLCSHRNSLWDHAWRSCVLRFVRHAFFFSPQFSHKWCRTCRELFGKSCGGFKNPSFDLLVIFHVLYGTRKFTNWLNFFSHRQRDKITAQHKMLFLQNLNYVNPVDCIPLLKSREIVTPPLLSPCSPESNGSHWDPRQRHHPEIHLPLRSPSKEQQPYCNSSIGNKGPKGRRLHERQWGPRLLRAPWK